MVAIRRNCLQCARFPRSASRKEAQPSIKSFVPVSYDCSFYSFPFVVSFPFCAERFCEVFFCFFFAIPTCIHLPLVKACWPCWPTGTEHLFFFFTATVLKLTKQSAIKFGGCGLAADSHESIGGFSQDVGGRAGHYLCGRPALCRCCWCWWSLEPAGWRSAGRKRQQRPHRGNGVV